MKATTTTEKEKEKEEKMTLEEKDRRFKALVRELRELRTDSSDRTSHVSR